MFQLCAFADEISPDLAEQIKVCKEVGVTHFELRGVEGKNVLDFDDAFATKVRDELTKAGLGVASIGSPIGKVPITDSWFPHFEKFKRAVALAEHFKSPLIRLFSYYPEKGQPQSSLAGHRDEVLRRFRDKIKYMESRPGASKGITLVHENEKDIFGEKGAACLDLLKTIDSPRLRAIFDCANFIQCGETPLDNWPSLKPYTVHIHIKDALKGSGKVVPAGEGDGQLLPVLQDLQKAGYTGFLSLEPHLAAHGQFSGFSGPDLFKKAAAALRKLCKDNGLALSGN